MPRSAALAALLLGAGCNAVFGLDPVTRTDAATTGDGGPDGGDAASASDHDGDGVDDDRDNCPDLGNPNQDDTDGDATGDVCDLCPMQVDGATPANIDGDQIGDACGDPSVGTVQCVAWFDGFRDQRTASRYASPPGHGTWELGGGSARQTDATVLDGLLYLASPTFARPVVLTHAAVTEQQNLPAGSRWELGSAAMLIDVTDLTGALGVLGQTSGQLEAAVTARRRDASAGDTANSTPALRPLVVGDGMLIGVDTRATIAAVVRFDDAPGLNHIATAPAALTGNGLVGLRTHHVAGHFDYLLVMTDTTSACPPRAEP